MPVDPNAAIEVTAYNWVPRFARGQVRDLRVRWTLEELGLPYRVRLLDVRGPRPADYLAEQPFGQVPAFREGEVHLFESGAICLHLAQRDELLLPADPGARGRATSWCFAALNSIEPGIMHLVDVDVFSKGEGWTAERRPGAVRAVGDRLDQLERALGEQEWLEGRFTVGDLLMASVLRILHYTDLVAERPALAAYVARAEARPAFVRALDAQLADFTQAA